MTVFYATQLPQLRIRYLPQAAMENDITFYETFNKAEKSDDFLQNA